MNILNVKKDFPVLVNHPEITYLDSAASSLKPYCVINKINEYYTEYGVNVNRGVYKLSYKATSEYEETREYCAKFFNSRVDEIVFTRGTSNSLNMFANMYEEFINEGDEIISSILEHHSSHLPWQRVANKKKAVLKYIELDDEGRITIDNFKKVLTNKTKVVAITHVSNVMGYITPVKEIIKLAHEVGAIVVLDAAQSAPHMRLDVKELDCDIMALSAHKMLGPTGLGILYGKKKLLDSLTPLEYGGDMIDEVEKYTSTTKDTPYKFETGTPMIAEVIAFKEALKYLDNIGFDNIQKHEQALMEYFRENSKDIPGLKIYNPSCETGIITFNLWDVHPHDVSTIFDENNVCLRSGHHCAQLITKHLGVLGTLRASIYIYNDYHDIDKLIESIKEASDYFKEW